MSEKSEVRRPEKKIFFEQHADKHCKLCENLNLRLAYAEICQIHDGAFNKCHDQHTAWLEEVVSKLPMEILNKFDEVLGYYGIGTVLTESQTNYLLLKLKQLLTSTLLEGEKSNPQTAEREVD